jgi:Rad3-related DNA helicase
MAEPNDLTLNDLSKSLKEFDEKIGAFSSILEKFGLDIITKMGQTNLKITKLTDKINELDKATIDIKSLIPQLSNVIENQKILENDLDLIKSLITNLTVSPSKKEGVENIIERNESATDKKESIITQLKALKEDLEDKDDPQAVKSILEKIKEEIFEFTGGHRILYEISQVINRLNSAKSLSDLFDAEEPSSESIEKYLEEKIEFWINKLMVKN